MRLQGVGSGSGLDLEMVGGRVTRDQQAEAGAGSGVKFQADVAAGQVVSAPAGAESLRFDHAVAVAVVEAGGGPAGVAGGQIGEASVAGNLQPEAGLLGPNLDPHLPLARQSRDMMPDGQPPARIADCFKFPDIKSGGAAGQPAVLEGDVEAVKDNRLVGGAQSQGGIRDAVRAQDQRRRLAGLQLESERVSGQRAGL